MQSKNNFINACEESWKTHKKRKYLYLQWENSSTDDKKSYGSKVQAVLENRSKTSPHLLSKRLDVNKTETKLSSSGKFQSGKIWWRQNEAIFKEIIPNQSIYTQLNFQIQLRNVSVIVQKEKIATKNFNLRRKKFILTLTIQLKSPEKQRKTEVCQFPSIMSEKNVRNNSRNCIRLRATKFFLVFAGQKHVVNTSRVTDKEV